MDSRQWTPKRLVAYLDRYIVGQQAAKRAIAIAIRNRWRRMQVPRHLRKEIYPNNILMIGPTGVGKTEIARRIAQVLKAPFIKVEATKYTEVGYVGRDVESMVRDLVEQAVAMVKAEHIEKAKEKAKERAEERLLHYLVPNSSAYSKDGYQHTLEHFRTLLKEGKLEEQEVEIEIETPIHRVHVVTGMGMEGLDSLQDMFNAMMPKKRQRKRMKVKEARKWLIEEEAENLLDKDAIYKEAIKRAEEQGIIFIDEIDKIAVTDQRKEGGMVSREGVQRDLLPIIEGTVVKTKYGAVKTDYILFIAAGAFHISKPSDLIPELQGRFPIRVELQPLTEEDFYAILKQPENALPRQYAALLATEGVELIFQDAALRKIAHLAYQANESMENIGARRLYTMMSHLLEDIMFNLPEGKPDGSIIITAQMVEEKLSPLVQAKDLSHYIL